MEMKIRGALRAEFPELFRGGQLEVQKPTSRTVICGEIRDFPFQEGVSSQGPLVVGFAWCAKAENVVFFGDVPFPKAWVADERNEYVLDVDSIICVDYSAVPGGWRSGYSFHFSVSENGDVIKVIFHPPNGKWLNPADVEGLVLHETT